MTNSVSHTFSELKCYTLPLIIQPNDTYRCENRQKGRRAHLKIRNLRELNIEYLEALLVDDLPKIQRYKEEARLQGYGPLIPCSYFTSVRDQKTLCREWIFVFVLLFNLTVSFYKFSKPHGIVVLMAF